MTLARGDWFYILLVALDSFFMARPYLYAIQNDNYRISEIFKNKRLRFVYALDIITVAIFTGIWLTFWFLNAKAFWGFLIALFFFIAEFAMYFMEDLPDRKNRWNIQSVPWDVWFSTLAFPRLPYRLRLRLPQRDLTIRIWDIWRFCFSARISAYFRRFDGDYQRFERLNNARYEKRAQKRLNRDGLIKIAITGSYGKTSVKNFLETILSQIQCSEYAAKLQYADGNCKTVNALDDTHEVSLPNSAQGVSATSKTHENRKSAVFDSYGDKRPASSNFQNRREYSTRKMPYPRRRDGTCVINAELKNITENVLLKRRLFPKPYMRDLTKARIFMPKICR